MSLPPRSQHIPVEEVPEEEVVFLPRELTVRGCFDHSTLDATGRDEVREAAVRIRLRMSRTVEDIIEIGRDLLLVKKRVGHGGFIRWIEAEFGMNQRAAHRFMAVAGRFTAKSDTVSDLAPSVLYALAAPSTPDEVVDEA